ncbi:hypothetical protein [Kitasatospora sp. NPDC001132]
MVVNANIAAQRLGFVWLLVGGIVLAGLMATGRKPRLAVAEAESGPEASTANTANTATTPEENQ